MSNSSITNKIFIVILQVILMFVFLTIFFFTYMGIVEKDSFKLQMNIIVDDLFDDIKVRDYVQPGQEDTAIFILYGLSEVARKNSLKNAKKEDVEINDRNTKIKNKAFICVGIAIGLLVVIISILVFSGHHVPFALHIKESIIVLLFVALTEIIFLNVITKNYWSVDPSQVRYQLGESVKKWIKKNHHN
jgi:hypothetical protein